ncbi:MAG TPA: histidine phosphatase family protein, partial [Chloroflexota bacterium]|nr:histidine phosphatase family protein [Chloroflexota bacterium]
MSTRLILVRHGQSVDNVAGKLSGWLDSDLTPHGERQALHAAQHVVERFRPTALYASPLIRTAKTAQHVARRAALTIAYRDDLRELFFGHFEGLTLAEIRERFPVEWARSQDEDDMDFGWPGGEERRAFYGRILGAFDELIVRHPNDNVVVVSHGGVLSSYLAHLIDGRPSRWRSYLLDNCAYAIVEADGLKITVVEWNVIEHLPNPESGDAL